MKKGEKCGETEEEKKADSTNLVYTKCLLWEMIDFYHLQYSNIKKGKHQPFLME